VLKGKGSLHLWAMSEGELFIFYVQVKKRATSTKGKAGTLVEGTAESHATHQGAGKQFHTPESSRGVE